MTYIKLGFNGWTIGWTIGSEDLYKHPKREKLLGNPTEGMIPTCLRNFRCVTPSCWAESFSPLDHSSNESNAHIIWIYLIGFWCMCEVWLGKELLQAAENIWKQFFWGPRSLAMDGQDFHISFHKTHTEKRPVLDCLPYQLYSRQICLKSPFWAVCETNPKRGKRCLMAGLVYTNNFVETYNSKDVCNLIFHHFFFFLRGSIQHSPCLLLDVLLIAP